MLASVRNILERIPKPISLEKVTVFPVDDYSTILVVWCASGCLYLDMLCSEDEAAEAVTSYLSSIDDENCLNVAVNAVKKALVRAGFFDIAAILDGASQLFY